MSERTHLAESVTACAFAVLGLAIGTALATPSTATHYLSSHPSISATVMAVSDHRLVGVTDQPAILEPMDESLESLSQGCTNQPWFLLLGLVVTGTAGFFVAVRRDWIT